MTGARVEFEVQDETVLAVFERLLARIDDPAPALAQIGEYGVQSTRDRIVSQNADPLAAWAPLSDAYRQSETKRRHHPDEILILYADLVSTLASQADSEHVGWGSNRVYAAAQQFGRDEIGLPPRPFLGLTPLDRDKVLTIMEDWLGAAWGAGKV